MESTPNLSLVNCFVFTINVYAQPDTSVFNLTVRTTFEKFCLAASEKLF